MKLLISSSDATEAVEAVAGGADIVDVKNPQEGALGASFPWIIRQVRGIAPKNVEVSCTIGDLPCLPGSVSLAALGAASTGVDYVKVGLRCVKTEEQAIFLLRNAVKAAKDYNPAVKVVAAGYGDAKRAGSVDPLLLPKIADEAGADVVMVDTAVKDGRNLLTFLSNKEARRFVDEGHDRGLLAALAGSLGKEQVHNVFALNADIVGLRGAVCTNGDRLNGRVTREGVRELADLKKSLQNQAAAMH